MAWSGVGGDNIPSVQDKIEELSPQDLVVGVGVTTPTIFGLSEPQRSEPVSENREVQTGYLSINPQGSLPRTLDGLTGLERCISLCLVPRISLNIPEVGVEGLKESFVFTNGRSFRLAYPWHPASSPNCWPHWPTTSTSGTCLCTHT